jgi:Ni2+-binding GTPase involved in maturation of urease and hydrogenase
MINDTITRISTINLCFKDTSIFNNVDGDSVRRDCLPALLTEGEGGLSDGCQPTSGCKNKLALCRQMKGPALPRKQPLLHPG